MTHIPGLDIVLERPPHARVCVCVCVRVLTYDAHSRAGHRLGETTAWRPPTTAPRPTPTESQHQPHKSTHISQHT
eukprot:3256592-Rhodomonas_salina.1